MGYFQNNFIYSIYIYMIIANDYIHCNLPELTPNVFFIKLPKNNAYNILYQKKYLSNSIIYLFIFVVIQNNHYILGKK